MGNGQVLRFFPPEPWGILFGRSVANIGDIDNDGKNDFAIGALAGGPNAEGSVKVFSGRTFNVLYTLVGQNRHDGLGKFITGLGDVDNDGVNDFVVVADFPSNQTGGYFNIYSGQTGQILGTNSFDPIAYNFRGLGESLVSINDINNDGARDFVLGLPRADRLTSLPGEVRFYSGRTGVLLSTLFGLPSDGQYFGQTVTNAGDFNGDGVDDLVIRDVGYPGDSNHPVIDGHIDIVSSNNRVLFERFDGISGGLGDGLVVSVFKDDLNGDNRNEIVTIGLGGAGRIRVYGYNRTHFSTLQISASTGGTQIYSFDYGPQNAGKLIWLPGSFSGTSGISLQGYNIPLTYDSYFDLTSIYFNNYSTVLNANGQGTIMVHVPADPSLAGNTVYHAPVLIDLGAFTIQNVRTEATAFRIVP